MAGTPKHRGEEISNERVAIEDELYRTYVVDEISIARLSAEIRKMLRSGNHSELVAAALNVELAYLHAYKRDVIKAAACLRSAERFGAERFMTALVESSVNLMAGNVFEAAKALERIDVSKLTDVQKGPLVAQANAVGALDLALRFLPDDLESDVDEAVEMLNACGATVADLIVRLDAAAGFIAKEVNHPLLGYKRVVMKTEDCLMYRFGLRMPPEDIAELNGRVISFMVERFDEPLDRVVSIGAMPFKPEYRDENWRTYNASF